MTPMIIPVFWYLQGAGTLQDSFLWMVFRRSNLFDFQWHHSVSWRSLFFQRHLAHFGHHGHYALRKPRSTNTGSSVAMTRTWLDMLGHDSEFLNMSRLYDGCKTYHQRGNPWFSMVLHVFFGWWPCSSSWSTLVPPASEEVPGANDFNIVINCNPHCRQFWILVVCVVCNTSDINLWQQKRMMLVAINARLSPSFNVFHVTCNARRSLLLYQGLCKTLQTGTNDPSSVLKLPRRTSGLFFWMVFRHMFKLYTKIQTAFICKMKILSVWQRGCTRF